ncbi:MAG: thiamine phosphate synthase [Gemmatimonadota bacterium]|nr:thiamine phosphate synthase [Gemmatimonadota bacterium]
MSIDRARPLLCFIHDARPDETPDELWDLSDEVWEDVDMVQVRAKDLEDSEYVELVKGWIDRLEGTDTLVIVNDRMDVAREADADGVHLGRDDVPLEAAREQAGEEFVIGSTTHDRDEVLIAQAQGASYAGLGSFFHSETKPDAERLDPWKSGLMERIPALQIPVIGVGGLTPDRVEDAFRIPAVTGVAASSAIQKADDPAAAIEAFRGALSRAWDARVSASASSSKSR